MNEAQKIPNETATRIYNAIIFIEENLDKKLMLEEVCKKAHFSPFHFHRLFSVVTGETFTSFINRKRIEKAASFLMHQKEKNITEIAEILGFADVSSFSKSFKKFYGISPSTFKNETPNKFSKICKTESKNGTIKVAFEQYICNVNNALNWLQMNAKTTVQVLEDIEVASISHKGKMDAIGNVYQRLIQWAAPKGLMNQNTKMITIYHDSPKITDPNQLRMSACIVLNKPVKTDNLVSLRTIKGSKCIISRFEIQPHQFQQAWESNFVWMAENGYKKADVDPFEIYHNNAQEHPENKFIVDLCIPVL